MRLRLGRPDIAKHADRFTVPAAQPDSPLSVRWLGVAALLIDDASTRILDQLATQDGVAVQLPTVWQREDPWIWS